METKILKLKGTKREVSTTEQPTQVLKLSGKMREVSECIEQTFSELLGD